MSNYSRYKRCKIAHNKMGDIMKNLWTQSAQMPQFDSLSGELKTDVLIIGGGLTGLLCAKNLSEQGVNYALIERERIFSGTSANTTAKITAQHGFIYDKIIMKYGIEAAKQYYSANTQAIKKYEEMCSNIDCDFEKRDNYVFCRTDKSRVQRELRALQCIGANAVYKKELSLPITVVGAIKFENQAQFNPYKFASHIARGLNIFENTAALSFEGHTVKTNRGKIKAKKIIVATHFPIFNNHGGYFLKMYQHRSYVIALKDAEALNGMYVDEDLKGFSFRSYKNLLLLGGGSHRTGKKGGSYGELIAFTKAHYPRAKIVSNWATQDCMSLDSMAYVGQYSKMTPNLLVASGYNKWGMTTSLIAADILCDLALEKENQHAHLFSPSRNILHPQLACNALEAASGLLSFSTPRCPHLGCALKWNKQEHSWDCSCHGSRFSKQGRLLDNPANGDLKL